MRLEIPAWCRLVDLAMAGALGARWLHLAHRGSLASAGGDPSHMTKVLGTGYAAALGCWLASTGKVRSVRAGIAAVGLAGAGVTLRIAGQSALGDGFSWGAAPRAEGLVTRGVYRFVKHPLLLGFFFEVLSLLSFSAVQKSSRAAIGGATVLAAIAQARAEEHALQNRFGKGWEEYRGRKIV